MDLGRVHLRRADRAAARSSSRRRWTPVLAAAEINFIRQLAPFQKFELVTRIVTWDDKYAYMEQRFESDGVLCAHAFVKGLFLDAAAGSQARTVVAGARAHGRAAGDAARRWRSGRSSATSRSRMREPWTRDWNR